MEQEKEKICTDYGYFTDIPPNDLPMFAKIVLLEDRKSVV